MAAADEQISKVRIGQILHHRRASGMRHTPADIPHDAGEAWRKCPSALDPARAQPASGKTVITL
jgi:hypothetical protein